MIIKKIIKNLGWFDKHEIKFGAQKKTRPRFEARKLYFSAFFL